jgi:uroporphyrinogen-III synthase
MANAAADQRLPAQRFHIALTRPHLQAQTGDPTAVQLSQRGHAVIDCALTTLRNASDAELAFAKEVIGAADLVVLISPMAAQAAAQDCKTALQGKPLAVMGAGSQAILQEHGWAAEQLLVSESNDGLGLVTAILARLSSQNALKKRMKPAVVAIGRAQNGKNDLAEALRASGVDVRFATLYHRDALAWPEGLAEKLAEAAQTGLLRLLFTTGSAPAAFVSRLSAMQRTITKQALAVCTHPNVAAAATQAGFTQLITASGNSADWIAALESGA